MIYSEDKNIDYKDVPKDHWAYKAIQNLVDEGVIKKDSLFYKGDDTVSRYDFAKGLNDAFEKLDTEKANKGDMIVLESLVYEFSKELTKMGYNKSVFIDKIDDLNKKISENDKELYRLQEKIEELEKRIKVLEKK